MSQHDMTLDNASGLSFRTDANAALQALASQSSGASAPSPTFPCQVWGDTGTGRLKQRNAANSAWLDKGPLDSPLRDAASQGEFVADTGAVNAYVCNFVPAITARSEATPIRFKAANANTGASTINDGVGVVAIVGGSHAALQGGEIVANGIAWIQWNSSIGGGSYVLLFCTGAPEQVANATKSQHSLPLGQAQTILSDVIGSMRNAKMSIATASATATFTADEIAVATAIGGLGYKLANFNKTINLATTGAGGMDTGSAPASGFVSIYAIYNPTTSTAALLACNQTTSSGPVYTGANMPSGYTASALVSAWGTTASSQLAISMQVDRQINVALTTINTSTVNQSNSSINMSAIVPTAAKEIGGMMQVGSTAASYSSMALSGTAGAVGSRNVGGQIVASASVLGSFSGLSLITPATCFYSANASAGALSSTAYLTSYTI